MEKIQLAADTSSFFYRYFFYFYLVGSAINVYVLFFRDDLILPGTFIINGLDFTTISKVIIFIAYSIFAFYLYSLNQTQSVVIEGSFIYITYRKITVKVSRADIIDAVIEQDRMPTMKIFFRKPLIFGNFIEFYPIFTGFLRIGQLSQRIEPDLLFFLKGGITYEEFIKRNTIEQ